MNFIGKILPVDGYTVELNGPLPVDYIRSLTHLYQPLIGIEATSLYQTLLNDIPLKIETNIQTHHTLMNYLNLPLNEIYEARLKLEGIGLLKTYKNEIKGRKYYTYELQCPFAPEEFFNDVMLSELLYHHIGDAKYQLLKNHYFKKGAKKEKDITVSFYDVFQTIKITNRQVDTVKRKEKKETRFVDLIDFTWIETLLKQKMISPEKILTKQNKKKISEIMFLYDLEPYEIEKAILWALTDENKLDIDEYRNACHDIFKMKNNHTTLHLAAKNKYEKKEEQQEEPITKEEQLITQFETISPKQLLEDLSSGNQASEREMKMVSDIMVNYGLPSPVMNVLIHYVLIQSNMKLSKAYLDTIASHWSRARLETAKEAMEFAKNEIKKYQKATNKKRHTTKQRSKEVIPEWFHERKRKQQPKHNSHKDLEAEKNELESLLKQYANEE